LQNPELFLEKKLHMNAETLLKRIWQIVSNKPALTSEEISWLKDYTTFRQQQKLEQERSEKEAQSWDDWRDSLLHPP